MQTEYVGDKRDAYEKKGAFEHNEDVLGKFWDEAKNAIKRKLAEFPVKYVNGDNYCAVYDLARTWDENQEDAINSLAADAAEDYIASKWYEMVEEDKIAAGRMAEYAAAITWALELMQMKVVHHENRFRIPFSLVAEVSVTTDNDDESILLRPEYAIDTPIPFHVSAFVYAEKEYCEEERRVIIPNDAKLIFNGTPIEASINTTTGEITGEVEVTESKPGTYSYPVFCKAKYWKHDGYEFSAFGEKNSPSVKVVLPTEAPDSPGDGGSHGGYDQIKP